MLRIPFPKPAAILSVLVLGCAVAHGHPGHEVIPVATTPAAGDKPAVTITVEGEYRVIKSNGLPDHAPGTFPRRGNPNTIAAQNYSFRMPVTPKVAAAPVRGDGWWWGVAINGVPFEPGTGETWNNDPQSGWRYEAATGFLNLGLDEHHAHVQPNGSYHYHALPKGIVDRLGGDGKKMLLVGWAADGFPLYSGWAHAEAKDPKSALRQMKSSYRLKKGARPAQANGPGGNYDGRFTQDFEFVKDSGDLDEFNGREGVTPELPGGTYYYLITPEFPFVPRGWRGTPDPSFQKEGGPGGPGGPGRRPPVGGAPRGFFENGGDPPPEGGRAGRPPLPPVFNALDANHDGVIDASELAKAAEVLKTLDRNGDGKLTPEEFRPGRPGGPGGPGPGGPGAPE